MVSQSDRCLCVVLVDEGVFAESKVTGGKRRYCSWRLCSLRFCS
jgi:hypothetical protein